MEQARVMDKILENYRQGRDLTPAELELLKEWLNKIHVTPEKNHEDSGSSIAFERTEWPNEKDDEKSDEAIDDLLAKE